MTAFVCAAMRVVLLLFSTCFLKQTLGFQLKSPGKVSGAKSADSEPTTVGFEKFGVIDAERRKIFQGFLSIGTSIVCFAPQQANAARGAAELDFEYYMRDLVGGNKREGNVQASAPPPAAAPRIIEQPLLSLLLNDGCTPACVPARVLKSTIGDNSVTSSVISDRMNDYREKSSRSFSAQKKWDLEHVDDQYYFDLTSYSLWRTAADLIPDYAMRDRFARDIGREIYRQAKEDGLLKKTAKQGDLLTATVPYMIEILNLFKDSKFCESYRIGAEQNDKKDDAIGFDEFDDEDLQGGAPVNCLVSVYSPATLGASLQITGEKSRFSPEFVGTTLAAMWESAGIKVSYETYFVDREYRPNPKGT
mmetsp:Transcript_22914/g.32064  ORF Transcript_22914/g.32064 Transcript_22914/m.32064 type:complete len:362 (+) Transcript_22914:154-1239(+)